MVVLETVIWMCLSFHKRVPKFSFGMIGFIGRNDVASKPIGSYLWILFYQRRIFELYYEGFYFFTLAGSTNDHIHYQQVYLPRLLWSMSRVKPFQISKFLVKWKEFWVSIFSILYLFLYNIQSTRYPVSFVHFYISNPGIKYMTQSF